MRLYVVAYPELEAGDLELIQECRKDNDRLYGSIAPHFTFVFLVDDMAVGDFVAEVKQQLRGAAPISFVLRCATINKDAFSEYYFAFLIPDEGHSHIKKLHDKLYSGALDHHHRLDIDYIPHIEIANSLDKMAIKRLVDEWNTNDLAIKGRISAIDIISYEHKVLETVEQIVLK